MRLAGQLKNGFFPIPEEAVDLILGHLRMPDKPPDPGLKLDRVAIIDPCAGEGKALEQLAQGLSLSAAGATPVNRFAIELNSAQAERIREAYPDTRLLGPCSFHASQVSMHSMSLVYCNPPYDSEMGGGGREELSFVSKAIGLLELGGILVLVVPANQVYGNREMCDVLDTWFEDLEIYVFPDSIRKYKECVVFGKKRKMALPKELRYSQGILSNRGVPSRRIYDEAGLVGLPRLGHPQYDSWQWGVPVELSERSDIDRWTLPFSWGPRVFAKTGLTEEELESALASSPLYERLKSRKYAALKRPPLSLSKGHTSLLLLTGLLDGYVPSDPPHVVRGYCGKTWTKIRTDEHVTEAGTHVLKKVYAETPEPICRAVWPDGKIHTFSEKVPAAEAQEDLVLESDGEEEEI